jgi:hypothetical protein
LLLPAGPLPDRWSDTHPLNGPCWSPLQEYTGNVAYVWMHFVANGHPTQDMLVGIGLALVPFLIAVAWASYIFWDEPIRARLRAALRGCR